MRVSWGSVVANLTLEKPLARPFSNLSNKSSPTICETRVTLLTQLSLPTNT